MLILLTETFVSVNKNLLFLDFLSSSDSSIYADNRQ